MIKQNFIIYICIALINIFFIPIPIAIASGNPTFPATILYYPLLYILYIIISTIIAEKKNKILAFSTLLIGIPFSFVFPGSTIGEKNIIHKIYLGIQIFWVAWLLLFIFFRFYKKMVMSTRKFFYVTIAILVMFNITLNVLLSFKSFKNFFEGI